MTAIPLINFENSDEQLRERVRWCLGESGLSMRAASKKAGLGESAVRDILRNIDQSPRINTIRRLAKVFKVREEWLAFGRVDRELNRLIISNYVTPDPVWFSNLEVVNR